MGDKLGGFSGDRMDWSESATKRYGMQHNGIDRRYGFHLMDVTMFVRTDQDLLILSTTDFQNSRGFGHHRIGMIVAKEGYGIRRGIAVL